MYRWRSFCTGSNRSGVNYDAGEEADVAFVAKDAKGFQKSLGGDVFTVSWERAGDDEPATFGQPTSLKHAMTSLMHKIIFPSIHILRRKDVSHAL